jgi:hypothetical protein
VANGNNTITQINAEGNVSGLIQFENGGNYICAQAYQYNNAKALSAPPYCNPGDWAPGGGNTLPTCKDTNTPCTIPYYVGITITATASSLTGLAQYIFPNSTAITQSTIQPVGGGSGSSLSNILPTNCSNGQTVVWSATTNSFGCSNPKEGVHIDGWCVPIGNTPAAQSTLGGKDTTTWSVTTEPGIIAYGNASVAVGSTATGNGRSASFQFLSNCVCPSNDLALMSSDATTVICITPSQPATP